MKIVVKSTKTISFDGQYDSGDESESDQEADNPTQPPKSTEQRPKQAPIPVIPKLINQEETTQVEIDSHRKSEQLAVIGEEEQLEEANRSHQMNRSDGDMPIIDSSESSTSLLSSRRNKDILGMLGDDVEN